MYYFIKITVMRNIAYISILVPFVLGSCVSMQYAGREYDDLYYSFADAQLARSIAYEQQAGRNNDYYDNNYYDTLVADYFNDASQAANQVIINNYNYGGYSSSYSGRLQMFHGSSYFDPYWRDPFYFGYGYGNPYYSFGYSYGYPYFSLGYSWGRPYYSYYPYYYRYNPWYYDYAYWGYGGYYSPYYYPYYSPYYYYGDRNNNVTYGRNQRSSSMSLRSGGGTPSNVSGGIYNRRDASVTSGSSGGISTQPTVATDNSRRGTPSTTEVPNSNPANRVPVQDSRSQTQTRSETTPRNSSPNTGPEYGSSDRTYTPTYTNPRTTTRPAYNNSRVTTPQGSSSSSSSSSSSGSVSTPARRSDTGNSSSSGSAVRSSSSSPVSRPAVSNSSSSPSRSSSGGSSSSGSSSSSSSSSRR